MTSMRSIAGAATLLALFAVTAPAARAQQAGDSAAALSAECATLRSALDQANTEISALKRSERGVRDDYRLRKKMAEAEALARRLTEAETKLRRLRGPAPAVAPAADPGDAPALLEARADILSDEARRIAAEAAVLTRASEQLRSRQALRRRAGQIERDPFAGVEGPKRQMFVLGTRPAAASTKGEGPAASSPVADRARAHRPRGGRGAPACRGRGPVAQRAREAGARRGRSARPRTSARVRGGGVALARRSALISLRFAW
jgi:hypothetical protein